MRFLDRLSNTYSSKFHPVEKPKDGQEEKSNDIPEFWPSFIMGVTLAPIHVLITNPISKLGANIIKNIENNSLDSWSSRLKVGLTNPFRGTGAGIISHVVSNALFFGLRPIVHSIVPNFFPEQKLMGYIAADFINGAIIGGLISVLDTIRIQQHTYEYSSVLETIKQMRNKDFPFFGSVPLRMLRTAVHNAVRYPLSLVLTKYRDKISYKFLKKPRIKIITSAAIGVVSNLIAARICYPLYIVEVKKAQEKKAIINIIKNIYSTKGFSKGFWTTKLMILGINGAMVNIATPIFKKLFSKTSNKTISKNA